MDNFNRPDRQQDQTGQSNDRQTYQPYQPYQPYRPEQSQGNWETYQPYSSGQPSNNWQAGQGQPSNNRQTGQGQPSAPQQPSQPNAGYRPYTSYQPAPAAVNTDSFSVSPQEMRALKSQYFGVFIKGIIHSVGSFALAQIFFILMVTIGGYEFRVNDEGLQIMDWKYLLAATLPSVILCFIIFFWDMLRNGLSFKSYFSSSHISGSDVTGIFGTALFAFAAGQISQYILLIGCYSFGFSPIALDYSTMPQYDTPYFAVSVIMTVILGPIAEELMYRGVILRGLSQVSGRFAIIMSAVMFGCMHGNLTQAFCAFVFGLVLGYAAVKTGSLILPIACHIMANLAVTTVSFVEYFLGEDVANVYWFAVLGLFGLIGLISFIVMLSGGKLRLPEYSEYHRRRTMPIAAACVSFWVMLVLYLGDIVSKFELLEAGK